MTFWKEIITQTRPFRRGVMKFATQISPLLIFIYHLKLSNFYIFFSAGIQAGQQIKVVGSGGQIIKATTAGGPNQPGMSGIQALAAAAAATSKMNTPGTATTLTTSSGQSIKLIQQPGINYLKGQNTYLF